MYEAIFGSLVALFGISMLVLILKPYEERVQQSTAPTVSSAKAAKTAAEKLSYTPGIVELNNVDERVAVLLMAVIADELNCPVETLHFVYMKEITS
ncbi:MAG: hypothetical protein FWG45_02120 [Oscillospiraceae bacterium]|nr:hypothetical protein [Oscillospiraceae bacterium]